MKKFIFFLPALIFFVACNNQQADTKAEGEKLMEASREWAKSASAKDIEKTISFRTEDAVVLQPGQTALHGKKEIRAMVEGSFNTPGFSITWEPQTVEVSGSGDLAYLLEKSHVTFKDSTGKAVTQNYNGVTIWKKQTDGSWKNVVDIAADEKK